MKTSYLIFLLAICFQGTVSANCPDLSGNYTAALSESDVELQITQVGCEKADAIYDEYFFNYRSEKQFIFDGTFHITFESDTIVISEKHQWVNTVLHYEEQYRFKRDGKVMRTLGRMYLNKTNDLVEEKDIYQENDELYGKQTIYYNRKK